MLQSSTLPPTSEHLFFEGQVGHLKYMGCRLKFLEGAECETDTLKPDKEYVGGPTPRV